ncbi:hypothetical protein DUNSADRAFT_1761 [Dunaliella salina]|uniref:Encoded protein n=1 Tax=Dunaliella salina TaxID=3046 RepID=A0ABQ7FX41_DUNSA|nr:hypothetical protein DUNSADRAFT_1761 [Dunaliella salina]|eukprot:KAF5826918.1 hypothetical protein DUNSADRAFT_1761 [Dunaliella salina]
MHVVSELDQHNLRSFNPFRVLLCCTRHFNFSVISSVSMLCMHMCAEVHSSASQCISSYLSHQVFFLLSFAYFKLPSLSGTLPSACWSSSNWPTPCWPSLKPGIHSILCAK